jgi:hypothetical protein
LLATATTSAEATAIESAFVSHFAATGSLLNVRTNETYVPDALHRAHISIGLRGRRHSWITRERMRASQLRAWQRRRRDAINATNRWSVPND